MLEFSLPPGCRRQAPIPRPKLGAWQSVIDAILADDKQWPKTQRHTTKCIFERLKAEHAYLGGYTIVKDYVRQYRISSQEMFVPSSNAPGEAQPISAKPWSSLPELSKRRTSWSSTCPTQTIALCRHFQPGRGRRSLRATYGPSRTLALCQIDAWIAERIANAQSTEAL